MRMRLWKILKEMKYRQVDLAEDIGMNPVRLCQLLTLAVKPTLKEKKKLMRKFDLSEMELFTIIIKEDFK